MTEAGTSVPQAPAVSMKREAGTKAPSPAGKNFPALSGAGTQKSVNPAKDQPRTMRFLKR